MLTQDEYGIIAAMVGACIFCKAPGRAVCDACVGERFDPIENDPDNDKHDTDDDQDRCKACGGAHPIQKCPAIDAQFPNPGRAIARQWTCDTLRFRSVLIQLDPLAWPLLAAPCARYRGMTTAEVLDRWGRLVRGTELPQRAA